MFLSTWNVGIGGMAPILRNGPKFTQVNPLFGTYIQGKDSISPCMYPITQIKKRNNPLVQSEERKQSPHLG